MLLGDALSNQPLEVLEGDKVIEVRLRGVNKGLVVRHLLEHAEPGTTVAAIGDDRTDDDIFRALPSGHLTVAVGHRPTRAAYHVPDFRAVRRLLRMLADMEGKSLTPPSSSVSLEPEGDLPAHVAE
jgi:trehalose 6-phosphate synthase/phosphatase